MANIINEFKPDYAVHPGTVLEEILESQGLSKSEFAERAGLTPKTVSLIVTGKAHVTPENAVVFERVLGISAHIWSNLDVEYRLFCARQEDQKNQASAVEWSKRFPLTSLSQRKIIPPDLNAEQKAVALLRLFGVRDINAWDARYGNIHVAFRSSAAFESNYEAVVTWLRLAEIKAEKIQTKPYAALEFKNALHEIRKLTDSNPDIFGPKMQTLCNDCGVALVMLSELPKTRLSGATRWLSNKALIAMSLRHKSNNHFWFTFFHEAAHIVKHGKKDVYVDVDNHRSTKKEDEADKFAADFLIPVEKYNNFVSSTHPFTIDMICQFAHSIGIAPGIVVGRLQHDNHLDYSCFNNLKVKFTLKEEPLSI